jgi:hypothetical protein
VCAQLGLPADQILSEKGPHLLLCAALLVAPSAVSWAFHKAAAAAMDGLASRTAAARRGPAGVLTQAGLPESTTAGLSARPAAKAAAAAAAAAQEVPVTGAARGTDVGAAAEGEGQDQQQQEGLFRLRMSYSVLPLVWAGGLGVILIDPHM